MDVAGILGRFNHGIMREVFRCQCKREFDAELETICGPDSDRPVLDVAFLISTIIIF